MFAAKYYPAGATTNSDFGVTDVKKVYPALREMARVGMVLCIHSEVTGASFDIFDREAIFIEQVMKPLVADMTSLKMVMEHVSTREAVEYVQSTPPNVRATITCHHLLYNRNGQSTILFNPSILTTPQHCLWVASGPTFTASPY